MSKQIVIVGGGISGLAVLHQLKKRFADSDVKVILLEKNAQVGGKIGTVNRNGFVFETGPNGFLDGSEATLQLARDMGLADELVQARPEAKARYVLVQGQLQAVPGHPLGFLQFKFLSFADKWRIPLEFFVAKGNKKDESVFDFAARRLGKKFAELFIDPMVSGIFAGDARQLNLKEAFPKIYELEQEHGSLLRSMLKERKHKSTLWSLKGGMGRLCEAIRKKYIDFIRLSEEVTQINSSGNGYVVETDKTKYFADYLFVCAPAELAGKFLKEVNHHLSVALDAIPYAPVAVVGFGYKRSQIKKLPPGFGYLVPSSENRHVLGVLFSSNIFSERSPNEHVTIQVMLGGAKQAHITKEIYSRIVAIAQAEVEKTLGIDGEPQEQFVTVWEKGIPQYTQEYAALKTIIEQELEKHPDLFLVGNYLYGVAVNDCTARAEEVAAKLPIN